MDFCSTASLFNSAISLLTTSHLTQGWSINHESDHKTAEMINSCVHAAVVSELELAQGPIRTCNRRFSLAGFNNTYVATPSVQHLSMQYCMNLYWMNGRTADRCGDKQGQFIYPPTHSNALLGYYARIVRYLYGTWRLIISAI